jgi:CRP/FNR family transcriptional regulator, nitrogen fixation regulation protein
MIRLRGHTDTESGRHHASQTVLKFCKGELVYGQGDPAADWFEVVSGTVRTCFLYSDGHRQLTGFFYAGDVFGIDTGHYSSSAEAVTAVSLRRCRYDLDNYANVSDATPVNGAYQRALNTAQACIFVLGRRTAAERIAAFLLATAHRLVTKRAFALPMSRSDVADHLGLTIHTVSRTLSEFVRRNLISLNGPQSITIEDYAGLVMLADGNDVPLSSANHIPRQPHVRNANIAAHLGS